MLRDSLLVPKAAAVLTSFLLAAGTVLVLPGSTAIVAQSACSITGRATSEGTPLPGVSVIATRAGQVAAATSTDPAGAYRLRLPAGEYTVSAELAAFARFEQTLDVLPESCQESLDVELRLASRARTNSAETSGPVVPAPSSLHRANPLATRFSPLQVVQSNTAGAADGSSAAIVDTDPATGLLPPGFSTDAATSVVAVTGDAVNIDRGQLRDRLKALGRGEFDAAGMQPPEGVGGRPGEFGGGLGGFSGVAGEFAAQGAGRAEPGQGPPLLGGPGGGRGGFLAGATMRCRARATTISAVPHSMPHRIPSAQIPKQTPTTYASSSERPSEVLCGFPARITDRARPSF